MHTNYARIKQVLYGLVSLHSFAHDDLTPLAEHPRTFSSFWLPKLCLAAGTAALTARLAASLAKELAGGCCTHAPCPEEQPRPPRCEPPLTGASLLSFAGWPRHFPRHFLDTS